MDDKKVIKELCKEIKHAVKSYTYQPERTFPYTDEDHTYILTEEEEAKLSINAKIDGVEFSEVE